MLVILLLIIIPRRCGSEKDQIKSKGKIKSKKKTGGRWARSESQGPGDCWMPPHRDAGQAPQARHDGLSSFLLILSRLSADATYMNQLVPIHKSMISNDGWTPAKRRGSLLYVWPGSGRWHWRIQCCPLHRGRLRQRTSPLRVSGGLLMFQPGWRRI